MSNKDNGGPAFPFAFDDKKEADYYVCRGMTLRDYFAAKAMQGMITSGITKDIHGEYVFQKRAEIAYIIAGAMLKERHK